MITRILLGLGISVGLLIEAPHAATAPPLEVTGALERPVLEAGRTQRVHLRIGLKGLRPAGTRHRAPMNVALVIDRSGSMQGPRIEAARNAAAMAVDRLARDDIVSLVSYDNRIEIEVPATKATDPWSIKSRIRSLSPRGSTAIYAGLQAGASELRKFKSKDRVNRIILLSDGLANVGPSKPADFAGLGRELASEGITVSTIGLGLGYNEDLMSKLAQSADGSHAFVQEPADLVQFFNREFDDAIGIVAQEIEIIITCAPGVRPMRSLGREATVEDGRIVYKVGQVVGGTEQALLTELEVPAGVAGGEREIASVEVRYRDITSSTAKAAISTGIRARYADIAQSEASLDSEVARDVAVLTARERRQEAMKLRDAGRLEEAKRAFESNAQYLSDQKSRFRFSGPASVGALAPLERELEANKAGAAPAASAPEGWSKARKQQREADSNSAGTSLRY